MKHIFAKSVSILICLILLMLAFQPQAYGTLDDAQRDVDRTRTQIAEFEQLLKSIEEEIKKRELNIEQLSIDNVTAQNELENAKADMQLSEADMNKKTQLFAGRLRSAYIKHNVSYLEVLFQARSFSDIIIWWIYLNRILNNDARLIVQLEQEQVLIAEKRADIEKKLNDIDTLQERLEAEQINLNNQKAEKEKLLSESRVRLGTELAELARLSPRAELTPVYAVVIDNMEDARPHHGINAASVVYEYEVEGGITRYLALFSDFPSRVGPIRSARLHSALLAFENNTTFVHAGGGIDVLHAMRSFGVKAINEFNWDGDGFFRDSNRRAPHNLYVNLAELGVEAPSETITMRPAYLSRRGTAITRVNLEYNRRHAVNYTYDPKREAFRKHINGNPIRDAAGRQVFARNIIIAYVPYELDLMLRPTAELIGEGEIDFYSMGQHFKGIWRKDGINSPTRFYHTDGEEIERVYGQTWIHLMRAD